MTGSTSRRAPRAKKAPRPSGRRAKASAEAAGAEPAPADAPEDAEALEARLREMRIAQFKVKWMKALIRYVDGEAKTMAKELTAAGVAAVNADYMKRGKAKGRGAGGGRARRRRAAGGAAAR